jgi:hypothetical protein
MSSEEPTIAAAFWDLADELEKEAARHAEQENGSRK